MEDANGSGKAPEQDVCVPFEGSLVRYPHDEEETVDRTRERKRILRIPGNLARVLGLNDFFAPEVWRAATVEFIATSSLNFLSICGTISCLTGSFQPPSKAIALVNALILSFTILATAPASGGHVNPAITLATVLTGMTSLPRGVLYIAAQTVGGILGAGLARGIVGSVVADKYLLAGCFFSTSDSNGMSGPQSLLSEFCFTFALLFIAFGMALDPIQARVFGPILAPFVIGTAVGLMIFISGGIATPGYPGAGMNPARCFGPAVVQGGLLWADNWVFWVGPILACLVIATVYNLIPPHHSRLYKSGRGLFTLFRPQNAHAI